MYWTTKLDGGPKRVNHAAVAVGSKIFSFGGFCCGGDYELMHDIDIHVFNTVTLRWKEVKSYGNPEDIPFQRYGHTVVEYNGKIYLWGGRNVMQACNKLFCFDTETLSWSAPKIKSSQPIARDGHSACVIKDSMYIFAGYLDIPGVFTQEICAFDFKTLCWNDIISKDHKPIYRDYHTATAIKNYMYVWGGREVPNVWDIDGDEAVYGSSMYKFDTNSCNWSLVQTTGDIPVGRRSHSAVFHQGKIYIFGGFNSKEDCTHYNDLYMFDIETCHWQKLKPLGHVPCPRRRQAFCLVGTKVYMFGGTSPSSDYHVSDNDEENKLIDNCDLYILDLEPSLKTLALISVIQNDLDISYLPQDLQFSIKAMTEPNEEFSYTYKSGQFLEEVDILH